MVEHGCNNTRSRARVLLARFGRHIPNTSAIQTSIELDIDERFEIS